MSILIENWLTWYLGGPDSESNHFWRNLSLKIQICSFWLKIGIHGILRMRILIPTLVSWISDKKSFLGKFWLKISKLSLLSKNKDIWYLKDADSNPNISFLNFLPQNWFLDKFGPKKTKLPVLSESWLIWYLEMLLLIPTLVSWNSNPKINFWANLGLKIQSCTFWLKIGTYSISRIPILILTLVFWISYPKMHFWANFKVVGFAWKLAHVVSRGCRFLFRN